MVEGGGGGGWPQTNLRLSMIFPLTLVFVLHFLSHGKYALQTRCMYGKTREIFM